MSTQGTIHRYSLIVEKVTRSHYPSFSELHDFLDKHSFEISHRTLQRDLAQMKDEFGVYITYDAKKNGYFIDHTRTENLDVFTRFLEIAGSGNIISESLKDRKSGPKQILVDDQGLLKGLEHLKPLLGAIKKHRVITFTYTRFEPGAAPKEHRVHPYLLKEYQHRWYLIANFPGKSGTTTFGLERISDLKVQTEVFNPDPKLDPVKQFDNIVGVWSLEQEPVEVLLSVTPKQANYLRTLPLHKKSQILIDKGPNEVHVSLKLIPNYELTQHILKMGDQVKVLEPKWLAKEVKDIMKSALKKYS